MGTLSINYQIHTTDIMKLQARRQEVPMVQCIGCHAPSYIKGKILWQLRFDRNWVIFI
jgi:hypothetical protein